MHALPSEGSMHDDELMDQLLRDALTAEVPQLSPGFDGRVSQRVQPRRLTPTGRVVIGTPVAAAASVYGRRLAGRR